MLLASSLLPSFHGSVPSHCSCFLPVPNSQPRHTRGPPCWVGFPSSALASLCEPSRDDNQQFDARLAAFAVGGLSPRKSPLGRRGLLHASDACQMPVVVQPLPYHTMPHARRTDFLYQRRGGGPHLHPFRWCSATSPRAKNNTQPAARKPRRGSSRGRVVSSCVKGRPSSRRNQTERGHIRSHGRSRCNSYAAQLAPSWLLRCPLFFAEMQAERLGWDGGPISLAHIQVLYSEYTVSRKPPVFSIVVHVDGFSPSGQRPSWTPPPITAAESGHPVFKLLPPKSPPLPHAALRCTVHAAAA